MQQVNQGFKPKSKRMADGGRVVGPGTGTSDDVQATVPDGSYIMPADSTQQIGEQNLSGLGFGQDVPVNLSNGEFQLPPEQVHAVGVQALDQMKNATHAPVERQAAGFKPQSFFADGGEVKRRNTAADFGFGNTSTAWNGARDNIQEAYDKGGLGAATGASFRNALVPAVGLVDDIATSGARLLDAPANALKTFVTGDATPIGQEPAAAAASPAKPKPLPAAAASAPAAAPQSANTATAVAPAAPAAASAPVADNPINVTRGANGVVEFSGKNIGANDPVTYSGAQAAGFRPSGAGVSVVPSTPPAYGFNPYPSSAGNQQGTSQVSSLGDPEARDRDVRNAAVSAGGKKNVAGQLLLQDALARRAGKDRMDFDGKRFDTETRLRQQDLNLRGQQVENDRGFRTMAAMNDSARVGLAAEELGFRSQSARREQELYRRYEEAKTPKERNEIAQQIRDMSGKEAANRFTVVPGGQEIDPTTQQLVTRPARVINNSTGEFVQSGQAAPTAARAVGSISTVSGKSARWDGSKWIPI